MAIPHDQPVVLIPLDRSGTPFGRDVSDQLEILRNEIGKGLSIEAIMDLLWEKTRVILPHDRIGLSFIDSHGQRVTSFLFKTDYPENKIFLGKDYSAGLAHSTLKAILEKKTARIISDLEAYLNANPHSQSTRLLRQEGVCSNLTLPLSVDNRPVGFLFFSSRQKNAFDTTHARILLAVTELIAQVIEKVWLIRKMEESRRDYLNMLGFVSHEMKSPLAAMMSVGTTYLKGYTGPVDPEAGTIIRKMLKISGYMINMVKNYLDMSRLESGEMTYNPQKGVRFIADVLDFAQDTVSPRAEERGNRIIRSIPDKDITVNADVDLLRIMAVNILDNAIKYGEEKTDVQVAVRVEKKHLLFSVQNQGVGFTRQQAKKLFKRFSRLKQKGLEDRRGSGLGLYLTWWIIEKHGGHIRAESEPGQWARFTVSLKIST